MLAAGAFDDVPKGPREMASVRGNLERTGKDLGGILFEDKLDLRDYRLTED